MEFTGIISSDYRMINGTRADGTAYQGCEYKLVEQSEGHFPQSFVFIVYGEQFMAWKIKPGQVGTITISSYIEKSSTGRLYNKQRVTNWQLAENQQAVAAPQASAPAPQQPVSGDPFAAPQELPFG